MVKSKVTGLAGLKFSGHQNTKPTEATKRKGLAAITIRNATESALLCLPSELKCMIWDYVFYDSYINVRRRMEPKPLFSKPTVLSVLQVCKQLNAEIGVLPYSLCSISGGFYDVCYLVGFQLSDVKLNCITALRITSPNDFLIPFYGVGPGEDRTRMGRSLMKLVSMPSLERIVVGRSDDKYSSGLNCDGEINKCIILHIIADFAAEHNPSLRIEEEEEGTLFSAVEDVILFRDPLWGNLKPTPSF